MRRCLTLVLIVTVSTPSLSCAAPIIGSASAATGPGLGSINDPFNQNGLPTSSVSGATPVDTYVAGNLLRSTSSFDFEWLSEPGSGNSTVVTYNLGSVQAINALMLWNEESSGVSQFELLTSTDGVTFTSVGVFNPIDTPNTANPDGPHVFSFGTASAQFVRLAITNSPQLPPVNDPTSIGEVAFQLAPLSPQPAPVPEPATLTLFGALAIGAFGLRRRLKAAVP